MSSRVLKVVLTLALAALAWAQDEVVVEAPAGIIVGSIKEHGNSFLGIPFAEPPIGKLRFKDPVLAHAPQKINATAEGPGCFQSCGLPHWACPATVSEDCLSLNVFTPLNATGPVPVMVFFHGGNYQFGYGASVLYDGTYIAEQTDVVVVTTNYRMGAFGLLTVPEVGIESNLAIKDQRLALEWVQRNIAAFGGDAAAVTIFGQSAGGGSVASHLISPQSKGLFSKAIIMSNPWGIKFRDAASMAVMAKVFAKKLGCAVDAADADCWYSKTSDEFLAAQIAAQTEFSATGGSMLQLFLPWTPEAGTDELPHSPNTAFKLGAVADVPIVIGTVSEEALLFIHEGFPKPMSSIEYVLTVGMIFPDPKKIDAVLKRMPPDSAGKDNRELLIRMGSEYIFTCPQRKNLRAIAAAPRTRANSFYSYIFDHAISFGDKCWEHNDYCVGHSCHGGELPIVWNSGDWLFPYTTEEKHLARDIVQYYGNFAHSGSPNVAPGPVAGTSAATERRSMIGDKSADALLQLAGLSRAKRLSAGAPTWPTFVAGDDEATLWLAGEKHGGMRVVEKFDEEPCDFWDKIGYVE